MKNITLIISLCIIASAHITLPMKRLPEENSQQLEAYRSPEKKHKPLERSDSGVDLTMNLWGSPRRDSSQIEDYDLNCTITTASEHIKLEHTFDKILRRSSFSIAYEKIINAEDIESEENLFQPFFAYPTTAIALSSAAQTITNAENMESENNYHKIFSESSFFSEFEKKSHRCTFKGCGESFTTQSKRDKHRLTHNEQYSCSFKGCGKLFTNASKRDEHRRTHNNKQYACTFEGCNKAYTQQHNLTTHMRLHTNK